VNTRKSNRLPHEAGLKLIRPPARPALRGTPGIGAHPQRPRRRGMEAVFE